MNTEQVINLCKEKEQKLLNKYFGNLVKEAAVERPETIGEYTKDLRRSIVCFLKNYGENMLPMI